MSTLLIFIILAIFLCFCVVLLFKSRIDEDYRQIIREIASLNNDVSAKLMYLENRIKKLEQITEESIIKNH